MIRPSPRLGPIAVALTLLTLPAASPADEPVDVERFLTGGKLAEGEEALDKHLRDHPADDHARFGLGVIRFLRAVEARSQAFRKYGLKSNTGLPFTRLPIPENPNPEVIRLADARGMAARWVDDLARVEQTLAGIAPKSAVKLTVPFALVRLDLDGDGQAVEEESLGRIYANFNRRPPPNGQPAARDLKVTFDRADAHWLRGYCHLLSALAEALLAHDGKEWFERAGHIAFARVESPYPFLQKGKRVFDGGGADFTDYVAAIHLTRFPVVEPARLASAQRHLLGMIAESRAMWDDVATESDDDGEWIPNPKQHTIVPGGAVTDEMVASWRAMLDELEALLEGRKLAPFWRGDGDLGVNIRRAMLEPREFDLVLWVQGSAAAPYLERGPITDPAVWGRLQNVFRGEFIGFALWFN